MKQIDEITTDILVLESLVERYKNSIIILCLNRASEDILNRYKLVQKHAEIELEKLKEKLNNLKPVHFDNKCWKKIGF